ncbi:hypothetical protein M514_06661, partial [Trichuris suis]
DQGYPLFALQGFADRNWPIVTWPKSISVSLQIDNYSNYNITRRDRSRHGDGQRPIRQKAL